MKRVLSFILITLFLVSLCGCNQNNDLDNITFDFVNYNNLYYPYSTFCAKDDTVFYNSDGFYNQRIFAYHNGVKTKLLEARDFDNETFYGEFLVINNFAYFTTGSEDNAKRHFYKYNLSDKTYNKLFTTDPVSSWMSTPEYIVFMKYSEDEAKQENELYNLYIYDIKNKTENLISEDVREFGIVKNRLRYIVPVDSDLLRVYEYNLYSKEIQKLINISYPHKDKLITYNFTDEYTIICDYDQSNSFSLYSSNGKFIEYSLPKNIQRFIAGDKFAYAVSYDSEKNSSTAVKHSDNGIYKINLSNGNFEKINDANDNTKIIVLSGEQIYILQSNLNAMGQYKTMVNLINTSDLSTKKLFTY